VYRDRDSCLRVDGGFSSDQPIVSRGTWSQELNLARDYYFKWYGFSSVDSSTLLFQTMRFFSYSSKF